MQTRIFDFTLRQIAVTSINGYQKHISPRKGFSCAHRVLYGGKSCSEYIKGAIAQRGLLEGIKASRQRFAACRQANQILKARYNSQSTDEDSNSQDDRETKLKNKSAAHSSRCQDDCGDALSELNCGILDGGLDCGISECACVPDCSGADCSGIDCGSANCSSLDCSGGDCFGMDCSGVDCGSCGYS